MLKLMGKKIIPILRVYFVLFFSSIFFFVARSIFFFFFFFCYVVFCMKNSGVSKAAASGGKALQFRMGGKWLAEIICDLK